VIVTNRKPIGLKFNREGHEHIEKRAAKTSAKDVDLEHGHFPEHASNHFYILLLEGIFSETSWRRGWHQSARRSSLACIDLREMDSQDEVNKIEIRA
jgi:hypothetical protein